jgi:hypothetical protein
VRALDQATPSADYLSHRPETTPLYGVVRRHLETWLAEARARGRALPRFVERELRDFLDCGVPANGFLRLHCDGCGLDHVVPFSCKGRGFCPSCGGRHMADTAAHLVDRVLPRAPVRQWVLTLPFGLRYRLAHDRELTAGVLRIFVRAIFASLRRRSHAALALGEPALSGAVTFVQRFGLSRALERQIADGREGDERTAEIGWLLGLCLWRRGDREAGLAEMEKATEIFLSTQGEGGNDYRLYRALLFAAEGDMDGMQRTLSAAVADGLPPWKLDMHLALQPIVIRRPVP